MHTIPFGAHEINEILAGFAEQESVSLSNNITWTFQKKFKNGEVHSHQKMPGYRWEGDERLIVPEEAAIVRFIFSEYLAGKSYSAIARELDEKGMKSVHGAEHFPFASVKPILKTEEYTGCMVMQKEHNISPKRQRLNRGELPKYKVDGNCSAPAVLAAVQGDALRSAHSPALGGVRPIAPREEFLPKSRQCAQRYASSPPAGTPGSDTVLWLKASLRYRAQNLENAAVSKRIQISF